ncbi:MAG: DUF4328 domain-containing protein [Actinobacteria bacterium]|nr:DUF4328 domain-containing protein [Actinomycetota bacterium]
MSDRPRGDDWWQDGDGRWYPPEARPASPRPGGAASRSGALTSGLVDATRIALIANAVGGTVGGIACLLESGSFDVDAARAAPTPAEAMGGAGSLLAVWTLTAAAATILLIVWMFKAHRAGRARGAAGTTWSSGWAIAAWVIPFASLVLPKLVANEIDRLSHPDAGPEPIGDRWRGLPTTMAGHWWWALTAAGLVLAGVGLTVITDQAGPDLVARTYRAGLQATGTGILLHGAGAAAGASMIGTIGGRLAVPRRRP